ncbi:hypothetical protein BaRGS_00014769 [Batillaria attramentaria]|uniref:Uncharacterized protein n=1 Tax=Batillaria attramentaria TaxID=370345 RepID=A0ABD0L4D3_9CAEN
MQIKFDTRVCAGCVCHASVSREAAASDRNPFAGVTHSDWMTWTEQASTDTCTSSQAATECVGSDRAPPAAGDQIWETHYARQAEEGGGQEEAGGRRAAYCQTATISATVPVRYDGKTTLKKQAENPASSRRGLLVKYCF